MDKVILLEVRRQVAHLLFGVALTIGIFLNYIDIWFLTAANFTLVAGILYWKSLNGSKCPLKKILSFFEREDHLTKFPGRGVLFFLLGAWCAVALFPNDMALASILILSVGDSVSHLYGRFLGKIKVPFFPHKNIEGHIAGTILAAIISSIFVPFAPALAAACIGMIIEIPHWKIGKIPLDDNLLIPIASGAALMTWNHFFPFLV